jgi:hypothetical protein
LIGLLFSCSELVLPKNVEVSGTLDIPLNTRVINLNTLYTEAMEKAFTNEREETKNLKVYQVDYKGQTIEAFCIYIPIETTEDLNPDHFLKTISIQINDGLSSDPKQVQMLLSDLDDLPPLPPVPGFIPFDLSNANDVAGIDEIKLDEIARYVISIEFDTCDDSPDTLDALDTPAEGIGLDFYFEKLLPGIVMNLKCKQLSIEESKPLEKGHNIFGNGKPLKGDDKFVMHGEGGVTKLEFVITLESNNNPGNPNILLIDTSKLTPEDDAVYKGEIRFFHNWTKATIDMHEAVKGDEGLTGSFPQDQKEGFDLSELGRYFDGFTFEGLEAMMYVSGSSIRGLEPELQLWAHYKDEPELLYDDFFEIDSAPLVLDDVYITNDTYHSQHLPGVHDDIPKFEIDKNNLADIFTVMPENLVFSYVIGLDDIVDVYPHYFDDSTEVDSSKITPALLIMLPLHMKATRNGSSITFPDTFGDMKDLFDRDKPETLFNSMDIKTLTMTVNFLESMFTGGSLFLDGDKETTPLLFYPNGVKLERKKMSVDFDKTQRDIIERQLIKPNLWIQFKKNEEVIIPKHLGLVSIVFEVGGILDLGDILE